MVTAALVFVNGCDCAAFALSLTFTAHAQSKTAPVRYSRQARRPLKTPNSTATPHSDSAIRFPTAGSIAPRRCKKETRPAKAEVLLAVFERPPEATGDTVNSAVVIASESAASYPGLKKAEDYLGPLTELATAKGFKAEGEPYALEVESRQLLRADFIKHAQTH